MSEVCYAGQACKRVLTVLYVFELELWAASPVHPAVLCCTFDIHTKTCSHSRQLCFFHNHPSLVVICRVRLALWSRFALQTVVNWWIPKSSRRCQSRLISFSLRSCPSTLPLCRTVFSHWCSVQHSCLEYIQAT